MATIIIAIAIIAIIVVAVVFYPRPPANPVSLPDYLSHCVFSSLVYHAHPNLTIFLNGLSQNLPTTFSGSCQQPLHTHDSTGVIHVETDENRDYTLGDWFKLWGYFASDTKIATFNSTYILGNTAGPGTGHKLTMTVNGLNSTAFQDLLIPRNAGTSATPCDKHNPDGTLNCVPFSVVVRYS